MKRLAILLALLALVASGCATTLGRSVPECDDAQGTLILSIQSVPGSQYVSCIFGLKAGWKYQDLKAESGESFYTLDSDRMGDGFVRVENVLSCDVGDAVLEDELDTGVALWKDVEAEIDVSIVIVPEGPSDRTSTRGVEIALKLEDSEIRGRAVVVSSSRPDESTRARIDQAAASGAHVIIIGIRDAEEGTLTLLIRGTNVEIEVDDLDDALEAIENAESESSYTGTWYYVFDGGCVVYTFNAEGSGVATLDEDIQTALSLYNAEALRESARDAGYQLP
jgi:hypothetical protein